MMTKQTLPKGWRWAKLDELCTAIRGITYQSGEAKADYYDESIACITTSGVQKEIDWDTRQFIPINRMSFKQQTLQVGDLLVSTANSKALVGKSCIVKDIPFQCTFGTFVTVLRPNENTDANFFGHWMKTPYVLNFCFEKSSNTVNISNLRVSDLMTLEIPIPPLDEQKRIAARLGEQMRHIEQARQAAEESLYAAWDLPLVYLSDIFNSQKAKSWSKIKLGEVCEVTARQVDPKIPEYGALPHINGENIESGTGKLLHLNTAAEDGMTSGKYLFEAGDVLYSKLRPYLRKVYLPDFRGVCSADMYPIKVNREKLQSQFLVWLLISDGFTKYADEESRRARMPKLNREQLFAFEAPLPSLEEQEQISKLLDQKVPECNQLQQALESQLAEINELPSALLRQAFAGEL